MSVVTISGEIGCRYEEVARLTAARLGYENIPEHRMDAMIREEFGGQGVPDRAWPAAALSILARLAMENHLVVVGPGSNMLFQNYPASLRVHVIAREGFRAGTVMLEQRVDRAGALASLRNAEFQQRQTRKARFGRTTPSAEQFDVILSGESFEPEQMAEIIERAAHARALESYGFLSQAAEAQIQFDVRLQLAKEGIAPAGRASLPKRSFGHPSEEIFANLLDFYHIAWEYEPRSFPLQWDKDGHVIEAFTPDFYLPEADLYIELTTMKQALVTKKNRKVKLLRAIYPHVNIQVFYQKDLQDLVQKYSLTERVNA